MSGELEAILTGHPNIRAQSEDEHRTTLEAMQRLLWTVGAMLESNDFNTWHMTVKQRQHWERLRLAFKQYNMALRKGSDFEQNNGLPKTR